MITLNQNENLVRTVRKHWFVFLSQILPFVVLAVLPPVLYIIVNIESFQIESISRLSEGVEAIPTDLFLFGYALWLLLLWMKTYIVWTDYYLDSWFITDKRIIDVEQRGLFSRNIASVHFERIQDVSVEIHGALATFFNFGDLHVQSAAAQREFTIRGVPEPYQIKESIAKLAKASHFKANRKEVVNESRP